ncbi:hypothetical protein GCM10007377_04550 [Galliscardovia ingluviei]|uniref:Uncharacterized protein n=1 Tax=Galliscardovia ingluviei TaxID=1769422 RepID=A0A8J3EYC1_9BIFI|nr:hypothetical protein GCM10007377_04550 [Galliscardovia ingluviei]
MLPGSCVHTRATLVIHEQHHEQTTNIQCANTGMHQAVHNPSIPQMVAIAITGVIRILASGAQSAYCGLISAVIGVVANCALKVTASVAAIVRGITIWSA